MLIFDRYGFLGSLRLAFDLIMTKATFYQARLMRRPLYIRGSSSMSIGHGFTSGPGLRLDAFPVNSSVVLKIGVDVQLNDYVHIAAVDRITIGDRVLIASRVFISDHNHGHFDGIDSGSFPQTPPARRPLSHKAVVIEDDVWIGEGVCILPGVSIGRGAVIGAGSVVTRDVPAGCVAAGNPARVLRRFDPTTGRWDRVSG